MNREVFPLEGVARGLGRLAGLVALPAEGLAEGEALESLAVERSADPAALLAALTVDDPGADLHRLLAELAALAGPALTIYLSFEIGTVELAVAAGSGPERAAVDDFVAGLKTHSVAVLKAIVDKPALASHLGTPEGTRLFLWPRALEKELSRSLEEIEARLFPGDGELPRLLLVAGRDVALRGEHMAVVGGRFLTAWRDHAPQAAETPPLAAPPSPAAPSPPAPPPGAADLRMPTPREMAEDAAEQVHWVDLYFSRLTPLHLAVTPSDPGYDPQGCAIGRALYARRLDLCVAYAANQTRRAVGGETDDWVASFGADDGLARVRFGAAAEGSGRMACQPGFTAGVATFSGLVVWAYSGRRGDRDRLHALQSVVARILGGAGEDEAHARLALLAPEIARHLDWFWATYWEGKLRGYLDSITRAGELVDATKARYEGELAALTKRLTDSTLVAVAVVLGSFVAAVFRSPFNAAVFVVGVLLYTGYLVVFPAVLGMTQVYQRFASARADFRVRRELFRAQLYARSVDSILAPVAAAENRFRGWFAVIALAYAVVTIGLLAGAVVVPLLMG